MGVALCPAGTDDAAPNATPLGRRVGRAPAANPSDAIRVNGTGAVEVTDERCLRVPYYVVGAAVGWVLGIVLMAVATVTGSYVLEGWSLVVVGAAMLWSVAYVVRVARVRLLEAIDLQLRIYDQARGESGLSRVPTSVR